MSGDKIKFGAKVKLIDEDTEEEKTYQIVGDQEADVKAGRISISSPIARALIGWRFQAFARRRMRQPPSWMSNSTLWRHRKRAA